jgi:hypothetical protein
LEGSEKLEGGEISLVAKLGCIQSAYEDAGVPQDRCLAVKRKLLRLAGEGDARRLVYHAILDVLKPEPGSRGGAD